MSSVSSFAVTIRQSRGPSRFAHSPRRSLFGWTNVRGAGYCRSAMRAPPPPLAEFRREPGKHFDYLTRREIDEIVGVVRDLAERQDAMSDDDTSSTATDVPAPMTG